VVIGGIITIAIADAFSDAMGIHVSKESENRHSNKEVWEATIATFGAKLLFALTFAVPVLLLPLSKAIIVGVAWGLSLLGIFSFHLAQIQKIQPWKVILEHLFLALAVVIITHFVGDWVRVTFV
jgi:VIT1/CCC1 family predicted Fe2+/Mn2+ transporter